MFDNHIKERIYVLIEFIRYDYPRAAAKIRRSIGKPHANEIFDELLTYTDTPRQGFHTEAFFAIMELHDIHKQIMNNRDIV